MERAVAAIASYSVAYGEKIYPPKAPVVCKREDIRDGGVGPREGGASAMGSISRLTWLTRREPPPPYMLTVRAAIA